MMKKSIQASPWTGMRVIRPQAKPRKIKPKYGSARLRTSIIGRFGAFPSVTRGATLASTWRGACFPLNGRPAIGKDSQRSIMKLPRPFFQPLAIGAPAPLRDLPVRLERMIHFVPPHLEKITAKVPELARQVDVVLGNLEDAIPADAKEAARSGFIEMAKLDYGATGLWTRI